MPFARDISKLTLKTDLSPGAASAFGGATAKQYAAEPDTARAMPPVVNVAPAAPAAAPAPAAKMSVQDFAKTIKQKYPQYADVPDDELAKKTVAKYPQYAEKVDIPKAEGEGDNIVQSILRPVVKTGATGAAALEGLIRAATGDLEGADKRLNEGYDVPGFGKVTPAKIGEDINIKKDETGKETMTGGGFGRNTAKTIGTGLEVGSLLAGGGEATAAGGIVKQGVKQGFGRALSKAATEGLAIGATQGAGSALTEDNATAGSVIKGAAGGAALGGIAGAAVPAVIGGAKAFMKGAEAVGTAGGKLAEKATGALEKSAKVAAEEPVAREVLKSGIDEHVVNFVRDAAPEDKRAFKEMFDVAEKGSKDLRSKEQAKAIAGRTAITEPAEHLITVKNQGVAETKHALDKIGGGKIDITPVAGQFLQDMGDRGVAVTRRGGGFEFFRLPGSKVPEEDLPMYKKIWDEIAPVGRGGPKRTASQIHGARQFLFESANLAKARQQPFSDSVTQYVERIRRALAEPLNTASGGAYMKAQTKTAEAMGALRDVVQLMGYKGNLENLTAKELRAGEIASRVLGNASDRPMSIIQNLNDVAGKYKFKPSGNWMDQVTFADLLENLLGTSQTRSLRGQVGRAGMDVVSETMGAAHEAATGNVMGLAGRALKAVLGKSKEDQIRAFKALLDKEAGNVRPRTVFGGKK